MTEKEIHQLTVMLDAEDSHLKQWRKHLLAFIAVAINLVVNLMRGNHSPLDIERCGLVDWSIFGLFVFLMIVMSFIGLRINKNE